MKIKLILMAAGNSRRFGSNKLLYEWKGKPLYQYGLETLLGAAEQWNSLPEAAGTCQAALVSQYAELLEGGLTYSRTRKKLPGSVPAEQVQLISSPDSAKGASYTVRAALESGAAQWYLFCAADQPFLTAETVVALIRGTLASGKGLGCVGSHGCTGNPAMFHERYAGELLKLKGDQGGRKIIKAHPEDLFELEVCPDELLDADTEDFFLNRDGSSR